MFLRYAVHRRLVFEWGLPETQVDTYFSVMAGIEYAYSTFAMAHQPARVWWIEFPHPTPRIERSSFIRDCDRGVKL